MPTTLNSFKRVCTIAGDVFTVALIAVMLLIPALGCGTVAGLLIASTVGPGLAQVWVWGVVFVVAYLVMVMTWLFKAYGAHPAFMNFCMAHPRFRAVTIWTVDTGSAAWRRTRRACETVVEAVERVFTWAAGATIWAVLIVIAGAILYVLFGALSAPWWAIVIIYLLLTRR